MYIKSGKNSSENKLSTLSTLYAAFCRPNHVDNFLSNLCAFHRFFHIIHVIHIWLRFFSHPKIALLKGKFMCYTCTTLKMKSGFTGINSLIFRCAKHIKAIL